MKKYLDNELAWEVQELPIYDQSGNEIEGYKRLVNSETEGLLSVCKNSYTPTKNEKLLQVVDSISGNLGFELHGFASFKGGRRVLAYLKNPEPKSLVGLDVQDYMIVGNAHDGSSSFFTGMTNYIYRCENMFSSTQKGLRVFHTKGHDSKIDVAVKQYEMYYNARTGFYEMMEGFANIPTTASMRNDFMNTVLRIDDGKELSARMRNIRDSLTSCIAQESAELGNNLFGLFNGLTRYTSHVLESRNKIFGNPFGHSNTLNQRGYQFCQEVAKSQTKRQIKALPRHQVF